MARRRPETSLLTADDLRLWRAGRHYRAYEKLGAHLDDRGARFAVWAPNADRVSVVGDWNGWDPEADPLRARAKSGIWEGRAETAERGDVYQYLIAGGGQQLEKADPFGLYQQPAPGTGSVLWDLDYRWGDDDWMRSRARVASPQDPVSVYEVHLGSWRRGGGGRHLTYRELAEQLPAYVKRLGFTHVELMPVMEHPFYGSWGYQITGYYAPTGRYGTPQDFMALIDSCHQAGLGVILDWVPSHFPVDPYALGLFDGTHLYEHPDPRRGFHPDWTTYIFDYGRPQVVAFLISNAMFWLDRYHADGLRVDAVASMLYLDYSRKEGEWVPNERGGRENLEAVAFLKTLNQAVHARFPEVHTIAEESTAWPMVSRPTTQGGLGFGLKWDMGWMNDTLKFLTRPPEERGGHMGELTFRMVYAFHENFMLPLSHDEVVYGKRPLVRKFQGTEPKRLVNLRLLLAYMYTQPGKKLLFMGDELAQDVEWDHDSALDWDLRGHPGREGVRRLVTDLNHLYRAEPSLHLLDHSPEGFEWVEGERWPREALGYLRKSPHGEATLFVANFGPRTRVLDIGVLGPGRWRRLIDTDHVRYRGRGRSVVAGSSGVTSVTVPPQTALILARAGRRAAR